MPRARQTASIWMRDAMRECLCLQRAEEYNPAAEEEEEEEEEEE